MDLKKLRYFAGVVEAKSMSRAAEALHVAQPALSKSLKSLELDLGVSLLQRSPQGVLATDAGQRLYEHCQILFRQVDRARWEVLRTVRRPSGVVSVGMPHSVMAVLALPLLQTAADTLPEVRLELRQDQSHDLAAAVRAKKIDFAVIAQPRTTSGLRLQPFVTEDLFLIDRAVGDARETAPISFSEASRRQFVLPTVGNGLRAYVEGQFRARYLPLDVSCDIDAIALITQCVTSGFGASVLPGGCLQNDPLAARLCVRPFDEGGCRRRLVISSSEEEKLSPACDSVIACIRQCAAALMERQAWLGGRLDPVYTN